MSEYELWNDLDNIFNAVLNYQKKNIEFNDRFINPWVRLGNIYGRQNQNKEAVQAYQQATEIDPDTAQNWKDLGDSQFKNGDYLDANSSYKKAISLDPKAGWPLSNLALTLVTQGKYEEAIPLYTASIELLSEDKDKAIIWNRLGNAYRKLNKYEDAYIAFQKADELDGKNTGFSDKLDEYPAGGTVIAPEEILEQLVVEQPLEGKETTPAEVDKGAVNNKARDVDGGNTEAASMQNQVKKKENSIKEKASRIPSWLIFNESEQLEKEVASTGKAI
ncbi:MAG: tetratricopeptide repeat protein, partial [Anaerolineales bacterium]|nr:tetratricopeptide repeat protein [Anaerolineales bacterium]